MKSFLKSTVAAVVMMFALSAAHAAIINWTLQNVQFSDGGTATGVFSTDSITGNLLSYDIQTSATSNMAAFHYDGIDDAIHCNNCFAPNSFILVNTGSGGYGNPFLQLVFSDSLTLGGTLDLILGGWSTGSGEFTNVGFDPHRDVIAGSATSVPEPAGIVLLGLALAGLGFARRQKQ